MKIAVLDIETTGFSDKWDAIVEIGITLVDTEKKTTTLIYDEVIKDKNFKPTWARHKDAWIFKNSDLTIKDVINGKSLESQRKKIQGIFDKYPVTAFNSKFDFKFMGARKFKINEIKCLMHSSRPFVNGGKKIPSVIEAYKFFFPNDKKWDEKHRGGSDSLDEGKILLHLCDLKEKRRALIKN